MKGQTKVQSPDLQKQYAKIVERMDEYLKNAKGFRNNWEIRSYANQSFFEGNHQVVYNYATRSFDTIPMKGQNELAIGKVRKIVRGIRNSIVRNDPRWHVGLGGDRVATDEEINAAYCLLNSTYKRCHVKDKLKDLITHGCVKTTGWLYVGFDAEGQDFDLFVEDPYNVYTSPDGRLEGPVFRGSYMIRAVARSLTEIKTSPLYKDGPFAADLEKLEGGSRQAESDQKNAILSDSYVVPTNENGLAILHEIYVIEDEEKKEENGEEEEGVGDIDDLYVPEEDELWEKDKKRVRIITKVGNIVIRDELTDYSDFPFLAYQPERYCGQIYHSSWIEPMIKLNKALDSAISNRQEWLEIFAKGRWLTQKDSKMSILRSKNGQIVQYDGSKPELMQTGGLPQEVNIHVSDLERYMEDLGGQHSESMGRLSGSADSGVAIAQLQAADLNNVSEPVDNLKTFLEEVAYRILSLAADYLATKTITDEENREYRVVGDNVAKEAERAAGEGKVKAIRIRPLRNMEVDIVPGSAFSDLQMRQDLIELRTAGLPIPDDYVLKAYKLGNTRNMIQAFMSEQEERQEGMDGMDGLEAKQAELENMKLLQGIPISPQEGENMKIHMMVHAAALKGLDPKSPQAQMLLQHAQATEAMMSNGPVVPKEPGAPAEPVPMQ